MCPRSGPEGSVVLSREQRARRRSACHREHPTMTGVQGGDEGGLRVGNYVRTLGWGLSAVSSCSVPLSLGLHIKLSVTWLTGLYGWSLTPLCYLSCLLSQTKPTFYKVLYNF